MGFNTNTIWSWTYKEKGWYKKLITEAKRRNQDGDLTLFLHEKGYDVFTIPRLCIGEIQQLIDAEKRKAKELENITKKNKIKMQRGRR